MGNAMDLVQKGIVILLEQVTIAFKRVTSSASGSVASLFPPLARLYRYRSLVADSMKDPTITVTLRQEMAKAHNMACLRRDVDSQATLLNLMLRDLLSHSQVEQANKLISNATFPESASNNELCRYLYYSGRIQASRLQLDNTYTLISRLAQQVVKAGLRKLHVSYSRLSLQDVAEKLGLPSATSAEFVVAKAVRDGVLDATVHHEEGYVQSHDLVDVYATKEPAEAFHRRIAYCLTTHNDAIRGMRYPPDAYKKQLEASRGNRRGKSSS